MLFGYTQRKDGLFEKTVHFGGKGTAVEKLIRDASGRLIKVEVQEKNLLRSAEALLRQRIKAR